MITGIRNDNFFKTNREKTNAFLGKIYCGLLRTSLGSVVAKTLKPILTVRVNPPAT